MNELLQMVLDARCLAQARGLLASMMNWRRGALVRILRSSDGDDLEMELVYAVSTT